MRTCGTSAVTCIGVAEDVDDETLKPAQEEMDSKNRDVVIDCNQPHT